MIVSSRGRYALRVMADLAENQENGKYIPMKDVAARQGISLKYLEQILPVLSKNNLIEGVHGKGGGYRLSLPPDKVRVGDVLRLTEGDLSPVSCLGEDASPCDRLNECKTMKLWAGLNKVIYDYIDSVTIADLMYSDEEV